MPRPLKVYRMPIGFHDAYIAVPTKKAAIEAWGSGSDIFQRGEAEEVTNSELTAEPLASPGVVIKRLRGTSADHLAALASNAPAKAALSDKSSSRPQKGANTAPKPKPRPSRASLDQAEAAIVLAKTSHGTAIAALAEREKALAQERRQLEERQRHELDQLEKELARAESRHEAAMEKWRS